MRGISQLLADTSGRCAAIFMKLQLHFLAREKARLERIYGERTATPEDRSEEVTQVMQLLPPIPGRRRDTPPTRRSRDYVA